MPERELLLSVRGINGFGIIKAETDIWGEVVKECLLVVVKARGEPIDAEHRLIGEDILYELCGSCGGLIDLITECTNPVGDIESDLASIREEIEATWVDPYV